MAFGFNRNNNDESRAAGFQDFLIEGEYIEQIYKLQLDFAALTNLRLIFIDNNLGSNKKVVTSIPYSKIEVISIDEGTLSDEVEIATKHKAYKLKFYKGTDVLGFYNTLAKHICK